MKIQDQIRSSMEAIGVHDKYKFESVSDDRIAISYTISGQKYLMVVEPYPYSR